VLCSSQDHLRTGMRDLDHPVYAGAENFDKKNALRKDTIVTMGLPKRLSGIEIADMLVKLVPDSKKPSYFKGYRQVHY
jgi:hypothetical protein